MLPVFFTWNNSKKNLNASSQIPIEQISIWIVKFAYKISCIFMW